MAGIGQKKLLIGVAVIAVVAFAGFAVMQSSESPAPEAPMAETPVEQTPPAPKDDKITTFRPDLPLAAPQKTWEPEPDENGIITAHGISTFGPLKYGPDFEHLEYVNPNAPKGGTFSTWAAGTFDSVHPFITKGTAATGASIPFERLMTSVADEHDALYGLLAETITYPKDKSWAIFKLREEARFSDGEPVTAQDFVFTYNILMEKGLPTLATVYADFDTVEALSDLEIKVSFKEGSNTRELITSAANLPIFQKKWYDTRDFADSTLEPAPGSGPYVLTSADPGKTVTYTRNPDYWGKDLPINRGRDNFDVLRYEYFGNEEAAFEAFKAGEMTFRVENNSLRWAKNYEFPALQRGEVIKAEFPDANLAAAQGFFFNLRRPQFEDPRVREAIAMMFNFEWSNQTLFFGLYDRVHSFWGNSDLEATGMPDAAELALLEPIREHLPETVFSEPAFVPPTSSVKGIDRGQLQKAGALLDEAGWTLGDDGLRKNANGEGLKLEFLTRSESFDRIINPYIDGLRRLGVEAEIIRVDPAQYVDRILTTRDFDVTTMSFANSLSPGLGMRQWFRSSSAVVEGRNVWGVSNPGVDALVEEVINAPDRESLATATRALDRVLRAMHIWVPQWHKEVYTIAYQDIYAYPDILPPYALGVTDFWWEDPDKAAKLDR